MLGPPMVLQELQASLDQREDKPTQKGFVAVVEMVMVLVHLHVATLWFRKLFEQFLEVVWSQN